MSLQELEDAVGLALVWSKPPSPDFAWPVLGWERTEAT